MSSIEPSLQPSFKFPSRHNNANYAKGLLDQSMATQLVMVRPARNTDINLESGLESTLSVPPKLNEYLLDYKGEIPVDTAIYVQPGRAEGMTDLAKQSAADVEITKVTSANNALKRGNYVAAEHVLGRNVTQEEIANHTVTPNARPSEFNPESNKHVDFSSHAFGVEVNKAGGSFHAREKLIKEAERDMINQIAAHLGVQPFVVRHIKTSLAFTGDSILGWKGNTPAEKEAIYKQFQWHYKNVYGKTEEEIRGQHMPPVSNMQGENRPNHAGKKAKEESNRYAEEHKQDGDPQARYSDPRYPEGERYVSFAEYNRIMQGADFSNEFRGPSQSVREQLNDRREHGPPDYHQGEPILNPQSVYHTQTSIPIENGIPQVEIANQRGDLQAPNNPDLTGEMKEQAQGVNMQGAELMNEVNQRVPPTQYQDQPDWVDIHERSSLREIHSAIGENLINFPNEYIHRAFNTNGNDEESLREIHEIHNRYRTEGSGIGKVRPHRSMKRHRWSPMKRVEEYGSRWIPDTSSFAPRGAVASGRLMHQTGVNAVPISAQIQVSNDKQLFETPLMEWVKNPQSTEVVKQYHSDVPISQYDKPKGVSKRAQKVRFGGYVLDHHKLLGGNILSLSHPSGRKVKGIPNQVVSDAMKKCIHSIVNGGKVSTRGLSPAEKLKMHDLLSKSAANVSTGADVNVPPTKKLQLILGEIEAGNDSADLKAQLRKLLPALKRGGSLSAEQCADISTHYL